MPHRVSVLKSESYNSESLEREIAAHFNALGAPDKLSPGMKVVVKPNLLMKRAPEGVTTTHPAVLRAVILYLQSHGVQDIIIADSPGGPFTESALRGIYSGCGMTAVAEETGAQLNFNLTGVTIPCGGQKLQTAEIMEVLQQADLIINVAKLKTHCMTTLSGGVKNMFGSIPGLLKPRMHFRFQDGEDFAAMLVDLCAAVRPDFTVVDAVECMEGDGPSSGEKKHLGLTLAGDDVFALDRILARITGLGEDTVPYVRNATARGLGAGEIEILGDASLIQNYHFKQPHSHGVDFSGYAPGFLRPIVRMLGGRLFAPKPVINKKTCIGCGKCAESCPPEVIEMVNRKAVIHRKECIRCYCCHEMCPVHAISVSKNILTRH